MYAYTPPIRYVTKTLTLNLFELNFNESSDRIRE